MTIPTYLRPAYWPEYLHHVLGRLGPFAGAVLFLPLLAVVVPVWFVSVITRWLGNHLQPESLPWQELIQYEPVVGARTRPNLRTYGRAEDVFRLTTDQEGWRGQTTLDEGDVVVFGDSFAFGHGVDDKDVYAAQVADLKIKPVASDAYSMVHSVLWMRHLAPRLRQKTVVWFIYCGNDLADNLRPNHWGYRMPFLAGNPDMGWNVVAEHVSPEPWFFRNPTTRENPERLFAELSTPSWYSERVFAGADYLIGESAKICQDMGVPLIVMSIPLTKQVRRPESVAGLSSNPGQFDPEMADRRLKKSCEQWGIPFVALSHYLRPSHYWRNDIHWNRKGHRIVAQVLKEVANDPGGSCHTSTSNAAGPAVR